MSDQNYNVAVKLSLVNHVSSGLLAMAGQFSTLNKQADIFQSKLSSLKSQVAIGAGMIGFGAALVAPFALGISQAGKLQQQLKMVQEATRAGDDEMERFRVTLDRIGSKTIFNSVDVGTMAKTLSTAGNFSTDQLLQLLPSFTAFAQTQKLLKGTDYTKSVDQAIKLAEITGHFDPKSIQVSLNALTKLSLLMPGSVDKVLAAFKYMEGTMKNVMGLSDEQGLLLVAFLQRMGIEGTRAGSQLLSFVSRTIPKVFGSGLWEGKSQESLMKMGMLDANNVPKIFTNGKVDPTKLMHNLGMFVTNEFKTRPEAQARADIMKLFQQTFGTTGTRIASILMTPQSMNMFQEINKKFQELPNLNEINENMDKLLSKQLPQALSNISRLFTSLGYIILPDAVSILDWFNKKIERLISLIDHNQEIIASFEKAILSFAGLSILGGLLLILRAGFMGLLIPMQLMSNTLPRLIISFVTLGAPILLVIASLGFFSFALYELYKNWNGLTKFISSTNVFKFLEKTFYYLGDAAYHIIHPIQTLIDIFHSITSYMKSPMPASTGKPFNLWHALNSPINDGTIKNKSLSNAGHSSGGNNMHSTQPIHVNVHIDGNKVASVVAHHIVNQATKVPNTASYFDTSLSPMPTFANSLGITY